MMSSPKYYRRPIFIAILIHIALLLVVIINVAPTMFRAPPASAPMQVIHATAVMQILPRSAAVDAQKTQSEKIEMQKQVEAKKQEEKRQADITAKKVLALHQEKLAKLQAAEKIKKAKAEKLKKEKTEKALAQKKQQEKRVTEKAAKLAQAKKLKAEQKILQQKLMQQAIMNEQKSIAKADSQIQSQAQQGEIDQYKAQILSLVQSNWRIDRVNDKLKCIYSISLAPDGSVLSVSLVKSSGDDNLDQSARRAIMQSSPLPVPQNPAEFDRFRQLVLTLSPQGFVTG